MVKTVACNANETIALESHLSSAQPVVLATPSFVGEKSFGVSIQGGRDLPALSITTGERNQGSVPHYSTGLANIPSSFFIIAPSREGFFALFCLSRKDLIARVHSDGAGRLTVYVRSGEGSGDDQALPFLLCVQGESIYQTIPLTLRLAMSLVQGRGRLAEDKPFPPQCFETLGWESGYSCGKEVTHEKVVNAVWGLRQLGIQPGYVIIDEGWQHIDIIRNNGLPQYEMASFEADEKKFPYGIKGLVEELHRAGVKYVGLWHGLMGCREGIHPQLATQYRLSRRPLGGHLLGDELGKTFQFFYDFYGYLRDQGVSFVKVGDQKCNEGSNLDGNGSGKVFEHLQAAIQAASSIQFDIPPLNADCLSGENLFHWTTSQLASAGKGPLSQNGQDIKEVIRDTLANSLWLQHLIVPDFDSWATNLEHSASLGMMHALSGSINIISDLPGKHDAALLRKMVLPSGKILKADRTLTLCEECIFLDPVNEPCLYKAFNFKNDIGVAAAFNLYRKRKTLHGKISPSDLAGLGGKEFAIFSHRKGFVGLLKHGQEMAVTLKPNQHDIYTFSPIREGFALIGCYQLFLPPGPIIETTIEEESLHISSLVAAPMIMYCTREVLEIRRNGEVIPWEYDHEKKLLTLDSRANIIELPAMYTITFE